MAASQEEYPVTGRPTDLAAGAPRPLRATRVAAILLAD